jgi:L-ascorbate metabolism protein UlaG (beta-lactamase superfamily)
MMGDMEITHIGHSSFLIKSKEAKILTDPYDPKQLGLSFPKQSADMVTVSHHHFDHDYLDGVKDVRRVFDWPGEYELNQVRIFGFQSYHDDSQGAERGENVIFRIETEGISIVHCGDLGHALTDKLIDEIGEVDILMVPVGGHFTIDAAQAATVTKKISPAMVIPMHYQVDGLVPAINDVLAPVAPFLQKMSATESTPTAKLTVKKDQLSDGEIQVVVLE